MPLQETSGNVTTDAYGGGVAAVPNYIEDVFSTWLYTGNGGTQTITNGIDLSGKGGMVWQKVRTDSGSSTQVFDTNRGVYQRLATAQSNAQFNWSPYGVTAFNNNGFTIADTSGGDYGCNGSPGGTYAGNGTYVSWTFRKQPKFFDVVTYTGTGSVLNVSHNLGSVPGCIIIKRTSAAADWTVYHRSTGNAQATSLNTTQAASASTAFNSTTPTSTVFTLGSGGAGSAVNASGQTYVAYLFAHDAGGFGLTGTDNVISCGSFTTDGAGSASVTLGYEPQLLIIKRSDGANNWWIYDTMRGLSQTQAVALYADLSSAESDNLGTYLKPTATGFTETAGLGASETYIYIAIRRGPMKVPTDATKVFAPNFAYTNNYRAYLGKVTDASIQGYRSGNALNMLVASRLTNTAYTVTSSTAAEVSTGGGTWDNMVGNNYVATSPITTVIDYAFARAPSFMDVVCYSGNGANQTIAHNLGTAPQLWLVKERTYDLGVGWAVYAEPITALKVLFLNSANAQNSSYSGFTNGLTPTSSNFYVGTTLSSSGVTYVAYLFATCAGVSKVGSYTGNGSTQTINCGFGASGARFVLIKRTDSTGGWYVYDTARGMTTLTDPYLLMNSTAAESATLGSVTTVSTGFAVNASILAAINTNGASYIFLAIA